MHSIQPAAHEHEDQLVSLTVQAGIGILTGVVIYGAARRRPVRYRLYSGASEGPRATAALLAAAGFVSVDGALPEVSSHTTRGAEPVNAW